MVGFKIRKYEPSHLRESSGRHTFDVDSPLPATDGCDQTNLLTSVIPGSIARHLSYMKISELDIFFGCKTIRFLKQFSSG